MNKEKNNIFKLNKYFIFSFIEGIDLFFSFSLITFLSIFLFENIESRVSILYVISIISLSYFSRILLPYFSNNNLLKSKLKKIDILLFLSIFYLVPLFCIKNYIVLSVFLLLISRIFVGISFSLVNLHFFQSDEIKNETSYFFKHFLTKIIGIIIGYFIFFITNDFFSNQQLNEWAWKVLYLINFIICLVTWTFLSSKQKLIIIDVQKLLSVTNSKIHSNFLDICKNLFILIPYLVLIIFSSSLWLPKFSTPDNMQFLSFGLINVFLVFLISLFVYPLINLIGKKRSFEFFSISIAILSLIAFFFEYKSSYSIDFLKFYISLITSFIVCLSFLNTNRLKDFNLSRIILTINTFYLILFFLIPLLFYYFINFSMSYNKVYLIIGLLYLVNIIISNYGKK